MKQKRPKLDQNGFASIVIALVLIIVLALLTIGFAQLARREQQNALNKQLADQAYYAAESGINDAYNQILSWYSQGGTPPTIDPNQCLGVGSNSGVKLNVSNTLGNGISYSCILINPLTKSIVKDGAFPETDSYFTFTTADDNGNPSPVNSLTFFWGSGDNQNNAAPSGPTPPFLPVSTNPPGASNWTNSGYGPVIEVSFTPLNSSFNRAALVNATRNFILYPSKNGTAFNDYTSLGQGAILASATDCSATGTKYPCSVTIDHLNNAPSSITSYLVHIIVHYDKANFAIGRATTGNNSNGTARNFIGQPLIDVTAKARNVLKRLQVRVPLNASANLPPGAIEGQSTCKRFSVYSGFGSYDTSAFSDPAACNLGP